MTVALNLVVIRVADVEQAQQFYETVGLRFTRERHGKGPEHLAANADGTIFEVYPRGNAASTASVRLGFRVVSVAEVIAAVQQIGAEIASPPTETPWGLRAVVIDPEGHRVEISQAG